MRRFGYLGDRLCLLALGAYALNHLLVVPHLAPVVMARAAWAWPFLHSHFDDLLLMPAALPVVLWLQRLAGLRTHDGPPGWAEMGLHLAVWSVICKVVGPRYVHAGVADPLDVLFFAAGGIAAVLWWNRRRAAMVPGAERGS